MATIEKRVDQEGSVHFRVKIRLKGHPAETATFKRLTDAKNWVQQTEAAIREGRYFKTSEARKRTLEDLIAKYKHDQLPQRGRDKETVGPQLDWWNTQLGKYCLSDITPVMIAEQRDRLSREPMQKKGEKATHMLANATVNRYIASLSVCFTYAVSDLGWLDSNPVIKVRKLKAATGRLEFLSPEERKRLLEECRKSPSKSLYLVVVIALATGARLSEITGLCWKDIDFKQNVMRLEETKNGERRAVPLAKHVILLLQELKKVRRIDTDLLFARADGKGPVDLRKTFARTAIKAGLKDFHFHDLRHTAASYLAMSGASLLDIAHILGHKTLAMVKRYAHLTEQHTAGIIERMNEQYWA